MSPPEVVKSLSQVKQKEMIGRNYDLITSGTAKVSSTFVPGNLNELLMCFDIANNLPEINAIQNAMRKKSGEMIAEAERSGHSEDVCTYVKADIGMMAKGNIAPNGKPFPDPDVLLLSYTGCFTFMKWFELLREQYKCPTVMLHVPYAADGQPTKNMRDSNIFSCMRMSPSHCVAVTIAMDIVSAGNAGHGWSSSFGTWPPMSDWICRDCFAGTIRSGPSSTHSIPRRENPIRVERRCSMPAFSILSSDLVTAASPMKEPTSM